MIKAKIVGACGYGGVGIIELLTTHPEVEINALVNLHNIGTSISDVYPHLKGFCDLTIVSHDDPKAQEPVDVVFMATPDGVGMTLAQNELDKGAKVIDYSGDFRFNTAEAYADYAGRIGKPLEHLAPALLPKAVYGLPELHRDAINSNTELIGNPGCFAVSCLLGLAPTAKAGLVAPGSIICDCKTGVSGAGKTPSPTFHYPARYENMNAYKLAGHQHVCEVERELGILADEELKITFTSQVVPLCRGIMSTLYGTLNNKISEDDIIDIYKDFYGDNSFVRIYSSDAAVGTQQVRGTNYCNVVISVDERTSRLRVVSYIDNLMKGQAGSAMQNMNIMLGLPEKTGFNRPGMHP